MFRRIARALGAAALVATSVLVVPLVTATPAAVADECNPQQGSALTQLPWPQARLDLDRVHAVTQGAGVKVAVIDSGVDVTASQMSHLLRAPGLSLVPGPGQNVDCVGHGTGVAGIIAAPKVAGQLFVGVAPEATIIPIKITNSQQLSGPAIVATALTQAVQAGAQVVNMSLSTTNTPQLKAAVAFARQRGVVVVCAAGNDAQAQQQNKQVAAFPGAYSSDFDNVIAVSAVDQSDNGGSFDTAGTFVNVAAPGAGVTIPTPRSGYATGQNGTSFATPFVSGLAALVIATHPGLSAAQVRTRIEATADQPPATVPSPVYGYGVINPFLAVTSQLEYTSPTPPAPAKGQPVPAPAALRPPDRHLAHVALTTSAILIALAVLAVLTRAVMSRSRRRDPVASDAGESSEDRSGSELSVRR